MATPNTVNFLFWGSVVDFRQEESIPDDLLLSTPAVTPSECILFRGGRISYFGDDSRMRIHGKNIQ